MTFDEAFEATDKLLTELGDGDAFQCLKPEGTKSCIQQFSDLGPDKKGRSQFWYGTDCRKAEQLCPSCAAYWHVSVARNCLFTLKRWTR